MPASKLIQRLCLTVLCLVPSVWVDAQDFGSYEVKAMTGDPVPGTSQNLRLNTLSQPDISQTGILDFFAETQQSTRITALYSLRGSSQTMLGRHIVEQQATPSGDGRVRSIDRVYRPDDNALLARVFLENITSGGPRAVYRTTNDERLTEILREGKPFADGFPTLCQVNGLFEDIHVERNGDIWFAPSTATSGTSTGCGRRAIYRLSAAGAATIAASLGASISGTAATLNQILGEIRGNDAGEIFFRGRDSASSGIFWYLIRGDSVLRIAPSMNADVYAGIDETITFIGSTTATRFAGGSTSGIEILQRGLNLPDGQGQFFSIRDADVAPDNTVVATMVLTGTAGGSSDDSGIYLVDDQGVVEIAREGRPAVAPNSIFRAFPDFTEFANVGNGGRVLFEARYQVGSETVRGWFYYDRSSGLREFLNGSTLIQGLQVRDWTVGPRFNERGELAMRLTLSDNNNYMVLYRLPGPLDEPFLQQVALPTPNPPNASCPAGFFLATVEDGPGPGVSNGTFGLELLLDAPGTRRLAGGLNFGGLVDVRQRGFAAVNIANAANENQRLNVSLTGGSNPSGALPARVIIERRSGGTAVQVFQADVTLSGTQAYETSIVVPPGFYVASVAPQGFGPEAAGGAPEGRFLFSLTTSFVDRPGGGFQGGAVVGGYHAANPFGGSSGFAAFCLATPHTVSAKVLSAPTYGASGARDLRVSVLDQARNVIAASPSSGGN